MKRLTTIILLIISGTTYSQTLKDRLQGDWVCTKIVDTKGNTASGKFGESNEYLKFSFAKGNLSITEAPFDTGIKMPIKYGTDNIDLFPQAVYELPERKYIVKSVDSIQMILTTINENGESIEYEFLNQKTLYNKVQSENMVIDNGTIVIKHIRYSESNDKGKINLKGTNKTSEYRISNKVESLFPSPIFNHPTSASLASHFTYYINLPENFKSGEMSDELVLEFEVLENGAENIRVVKSLDNEINSQIVDLIKKNRKHWKMLRINGKPTKSTLKLHFVFYLV